MNCHPKSGLRYIMSIADWPTYRDFAFLYFELASRVDWLEILGRRALSEQLAELCKDERNVIIIWGYRCPDIPVDRKAIVMLGYSEAYADDRDVMLTPHHKWLDNFRGWQAPQVDAVLCHTPFMAKKVVAGLAVPGYVLPMGWGKTMGSPNWSAKKIHRFTYNGVGAGKRAWLVPAMEGCMKGALHNASGTWMTDLNQTLNASRASLYLSHSNVQSFSTFRIWQSVASSAALVAEKGRDCWPMEDSDYITMPTLTTQNVEIVAARLMDIPDSHFEKVARNLHEKFAHMTIDHVVDGYLIPASEKAKAA